MKSTLKRGLLIALLTSMIATATTLQAASTAQANTTSQANITKQLVPLRAVAEIQGASVTWNQEDKSITIERADDRVVLTLGKQQAVVNGAIVELEADAIVQTDKTYISLSALNKLLSSDVQWNAEKESIVFSQHNYELNATQFVHSLLQNDIEKINELTNQAIKDSFPAAMWPAFSQQVSYFAGKVVKLQGVTIEDNGVHINAHLNYKATNSPFQFTVRFDRNGYVDDFMVNTSPVELPYSKPSYDTGQYTEENIVIGDGKFALPGTLTLPKGDGPFPVVILVHGSGPHDQDSTISGTKVFKDIAAGLASKNIAVVRYEKVTREHTAKVSVLPQFTIKNESVDDVAHIIELLAARNDIDQDSIYVAGHSQGGFVMPMILEQNKDKDIAGAILLSAPSDAYIDVLLEQQYEVIDRFKKLGLEEYAAVQSQYLPTFEAMKTLLADPAYSKDNLPSQFPMSPVYWWYEQRDYVPAKEMVKYDTPLLIVQGENDWQVTLKQYEGWKEALKDRKDTTFISYPTMNHLLTNYEGISVSLEYNTPANVSEKLITDLASWILK